MTLRAAADLAAHSFPFFLRFVTTVAEDEQDSDRRVMPLPVDDKPFLLCVARVMQEQPTLWVVKSRRMFMTWLCSAELVWRALTPHSHLFVQQTKEDDSDWLVRERCLFIWEHLPEWLRFYAMQGKGTEAVYKYCKVAFPNRSQIWGIAQGAEQFRKFTASGIFSDEVAVQSEFEDAHTAIMPLAIKGTPVRFVSSARGGTYFAEIVDGTAPVAGSVKSPMRGIREWDLETGGHVLDISYAADPEKDEAWANEHSRVYPGGRAGAKWRQEMERDFMAMHGTPIYDNWDPAKHIVEPFAREFLENHPGPYWRAMDYGLRNPTACLWITEYDGVYTVFREFYRSGLTPEAIKQAIHAMSTEPKYEFTVIDPRSDRHDVSDQMSAFYLLNSGEYSLKTMKANSSSTGRDLVRQWLQTDRLTVTSDCVNFINEIKKYVYEDWTGQTAGKHNVKEQAQKKDDHLMDALKYFANGVQYKENRLQRTVEAPLSNEYTKRRERIMHPSRAHYAGKSTIMRGYYG